MWPAGTQSAAAFTFDFDAEEVWIAEAPAYVDRPGVLSQGVYGAKVAVPLILEMLERQDIRATFFVPGRVAERYPDRVKQIIAGGHEVGHHGYTHRNPTSFTAEEEEAELVRGAEVLRTLGADVSGYRSPSWELTSRTLGLLEKYGFAYSSNYMDDIRPYLHAGTRIAEVPVQWILDDAVHFWFSNDNWNKKISTVEEVTSIWMAELKGIRDLGGACVFTMHPQFSGRPGRLEWLESLMRDVKRMPGVWVATAGEIAERMERNVAG
jgi:peptidoglycan-N-acetylglucosamine deacetylase